MPNPDRPDPRRHGAARRALAIVALCPLSGCCGLARLFCGPDRSEWVAIAYDTPRATLATFLEAVRRDNPRVVYACLSERYVRANDLDAVIATAGWDQLREKVPGLHLLGYAEIPDRPTVEQDRGVTYELSVEGRVVRIEMVRQTYWDVRYRDREGVVHPVSRSLDDTLNGVVRIEPDGADPADDTPRSRIALAVRKVDHPYVDVLRLDDLDYVAAGHEWKISNVVVPE